VVEPPGPIPNPEVKRRSADGSGTIGPVRVGRRQVYTRLQLTLGPGSFLGGSGASSRDVLFALGQNTSDSSAVCQH
jgi:hypothetical protein